VAAGTVVVLMIIVGLIGFSFVKKVTGLKLTRKTVTEDIAALKKAMSSSSTVSNGAGNAVAGGEDAQAITESVDDREPAAVTAGSLPEHRWPRRSSPLSRSTGRGPTAR
jgi:hypothetical protein